MPLTERCVRASIREVIIIAVTAFISCSAGAPMARAQALPKIDGPLSMPQAVDVALQHSLRVKAAAADARTAASMQREALAVFWPQLSANGYVNDQRMAPNVYTSAGNTMARNSQVFNASENRDANVTAMLPLFSGGRDYYTYKAAARRAEAGREGLRGSEVDVAMQARLDYIGVLRETENLRVTGELVRTLEERVRVTREAFEAGRVPRYYLLRDEAERANAEQMEAMARSRVDQALVALKTTLGIDLVSSVSLADRLEFARTTVSIPDGIREAAERQPDVKAASKQREAAEADVRAAYGNYFPQLSFSYMYDWAWMRDRRRVSQAEDTRMPGNGAEGYSVGLVVTLPVFDGFLRENALKTAKARLDRAVQAEAIVRQQIARDVNQAALMLTAAEKSVAASQVGVAQMEEEYRVVTERVRSGRGIQLELLDAQTALTRARFNVVNALADYHTALAMWLRATGRVR